MLSPKEEEKEKKEVDKNEREGEGGRGSKIHEDDLSMEGRWDAFEVVVLK